MAIAVFASLIGVSELKDRSPYVFRHESRYLICDVYVLEASEVQKKRSLMVLLCFSSSSNSIESLYFKTSVNQPYQRALLILRSLF